MPASRFEAGVRHLPGVAVVDLSGELDAEAEETLNGVYGRAAARDAPLVILNFAGVDYINSTGIALIVGLLARARKDGCGIRACGLNDHYRKIFELTRLADFMPVFPDERSAVGEAPVESDRRDRE